MKKILLATFLMLVVGACASKMDRQAATIDKHLGWTHTSEYSPGQGTMGLLLWPDDYILRSFNAAGNEPLNYRVIYNKGLTVNGCADVSVEVSRMYENRPHTTPDGYWAGRICRD